MSFSRRAKRGISTFSKIQWNPKRLAYLLSQKRMINLNAVPPADPKLVNAASEAMEILVKNGEEANAISSVPESEGHAEPQNAEVEPKHDVSEEQENGEGC